LVGVRRVADDAEVNCAATAGAFQFNRHVHAARGASWRFTPISCAMAS
jgi:hypothetical protein